MGLQAVREEIKNNRKDLTAKRRDERKLRRKLEKAYITYTPTAVSTLPAQIKELAALMYAPPARVPSHIEEWLLTKL
jgi:hypothetical protein